MAFDIETLRTALRQVIDPEIGMNIVDLGLVYRLEQDAAGVALDITMTSPACPMGEHILEEAQAALEACLPAATPIDMQLVWEPPWSPACMSEHARRQLGWE